MHSVYAFSVEHCLYALLQEPKTHNQNVSNVDKDDVTAMASSLKVNKTYDALHRYIKICSLLCLDFDSWIASDLMHSYWFCCRKRQRSSGSKNQLTRSMLRNLLQVPAGHLKRNRRALDKEYYLESLLVLVKPAAV